MKQFLLEAGKLIDLLIWLGGMIAVLVFFWGCFLFIVHAADPKKREEAKHRMIWGIVALFVMTSVWAIVLFIGRELGIHPFLGPNLELNSDGIPDGQFSPDYRNMPIPFRKMTPELWK